jgi:lactate dehydrogenase-like 2-hydroxyacid dehydrogenase
MEFVEKKHMLIVGYGDIGSACGKISKHGLGMKVTGLKRRPDQATDEQRNNSDEIVGNDQYDKLV